MKVSSFCISAKVKELTSTTLKTLDKLFGVFGECWVYPFSLEQFLLINFRVSARRKDGKTLMQCAIYALFWCI